MKSRYMVFYTCLKILNLSRSRVFAKKSRPLRLSLISIRSIKKRSAKANSLCIGSTQTPLYQVVLIQIALQTTESNEEQGGVADVVSRINSRFSTLTYQPVVFLHTQDITFSQYLALLTVADAFLVTSLREGMALRFRLLTTIISLFIDHLMTELMNSLNVKKTDIAR
jgi:hypothetical protein